MLNRLLALYYILLNFHGQIKGKISITQPSIIPVYLKAGDTLDLLCQQSDGYKIFWSRKTQHSHHYEILESSIDTGFLELAHINGVYNLRLTKKNVGVSDSGSYKCSMQSGRELSYAADVYVLQILNNSGPLVHASNHSTLQCSLLDSSFKPTIIWSKAGVLIATSHSPLDSSSPSSSLSSSPPSPLRSYRKYTLNTSYAHDYTDSILAIKNIGEQDVGEYVCQFIINDHVSFKQSVFLYSYPQIKTMPRSQNVVEGQRLEVQCRAWGWPLPMVSWSFYTTEATPLTLLDEEEDDRVSFSHDNHTLLLDDMALEDRAYYTCTATSLLNATSQFTTTAAILVRVRGKYAPVVPLVGIVLEFVVLCVIIYVYERKKKKLRAERSRKEALEIKQANTPQVTSPASSSRDNSRKRNPHH